MQRPPFTSSAHRPSGTAKGGGSRRRPWSWLRKLALVGVLVAVPMTGALGGAASAVSASPRPTPQVQVFRVLAPTAAQVRQLSTSEDLLEARDDSDFFVLGTAKDAARLRALGLKVVTERTFDAMPSAAVGARSTNDVTAASYPTFFGGYHTVEAHTQHLTDVAAAYPTLATVVDYGDSWRKTRGLSGHDLLAVCITKRNAGDCALTPNAPKPRSVVMAGIHARELGPPEIAWNWIDYLVSGYGSVPAVTALLDSTEVWVLPLQNPDGRKIVESGGTSPYFQRKNANNSRGACANPPSSSNQFGVDLNRNATFGWGGVGASTSACSQTYRGTAAASEPETQALQTLFGRLFKDQRGPARSDAAPATATGTMMTYHSYAGLILYPWGDVNTPAPNATKLAALANRMAAFNGYRTGQPGVVLYNVTGATDDDLYGRLGVASFTTELGAVGTACDGFMPAYSCVTSRFWPQEQKALMALAQAAAGPYR